MSIFKGSCFFVSPLTLPFSRPSQPHFPSIIFRNFYDYLYVNKEGREYTIKCIVSLVSIIILKMMKWRNKNKEKFFQTETVLYFCSPYFKTLKKLFKFPRKHIENLRRQIVPHGVIS